MKKFKPTKKANAIIATAGLAIFLCLSVLSAVLISSNYQSLYGTPRNTNAVMDLAGYNSKTSAIDVTASGKWEFFYNRWIVSEGTDGGRGASPDFLIDVPGRWTGKTLSGKRLPSSGYASYRFTVKNPEAGSRLTVKLQAFPAAYRAYVNGSLVCESGKMSKSFGGGFASGLPRLTPYEVTSGEPLTVVLEVSFNLYGGLFLSPWLHDASVAKPAVWNFTSLVPVFVAGMMLTFIIFTSILNLGLSRGNKNLSFIFLILGIFLHLLTTKEFWQSGNLFSRINISFTVIYELNFITAIAVLVCALANLILQKAITLTRRQLYILVPALLACAVLFYALYGSGLQIIPVALGLLGFCYVFYRIMLTPQRRLRNKLFPAAILTLIMFTFLLESIDNLGYIVYGLEPGFSIMSLLLIILISVSSFLKTRDAGADLIKAAVLEREIQDVKHQALKAQVKPHFMFNLLSGIQALYRKDAKAGEEALSGFAAHLRQNIDADVKNTIPFSQEIKNIMNYVELENLRLDKNLTLILDIDYSEFEIPVLSLQPLIENAIKYAGTHEMPGGFIKLLSKREDGFIIIQVIDNGRGFNTSEIRENASGIKNTGERFKYLLNAALSVESEIGAGTTVTVKIPAEGG